MTATPAPAPGLPGLLQLIPDLPAAARAALAADYALREPPPAADWSAGLDTAARQARAILVRGGQVAVRAADMDRLPRLGAIVCMGAGMELVDTAAARARDIAVTNGSGANSDCVADHAMGLVIALVRDFRGGDAAARAGRWQAGLPASPQVSGKAMGIAGLGRIGRALARRATAFDMPVTYHGRSVQADSPWPRVDSLPALAHASDVLVCTLPGGDGTRHAIGPAVFEALGPRGYFVNVGRGATVDTDALIDALERGTIAGAALDVLESEPQVPERLARLPNVLLTPHLAGRSPESTAATLERALQNLRAFAQGRELTHRVV